MYYGKLVSHMREWVVCISDLIVRKQGKGPQGISCSFSYSSSVRIFPSVVISDRLSWVDLGGAMSCEEMG